MRPEDRLVERLRRELASPRDGVRIGIGDDAAVLAPSNRETAVTTDVLVEGVDFLPGEDPEMVGRRAAAVNLSDLAAMGAAPRWLLVTVGFPPTASEETVFAICRGAAARAREHGADLVGGDLSASPTLFVSVTMAGELEGAPLTRSGARAGDRLYLSGPTGRAAAGLAIARDGAPAGLSEEAARGLVAAYRDPRPRVELGTALSRRRLASAAIDVSDGLGIDASRLARASGLKAVLEAESLPIAADLSLFARSAGVSALDLAIGGGDDYEILFAAPEAAGAEIASLPEVARIGWLERGSGALLRSAGGDRDVSLTGWDHVEAAR